MTMETTNDLKILEFQVDKELPNGKISKGHYGINVLKVQRIINMPENVVQIPSSHQSIMGIITIQDRSIPVIDLTKSLQREVPDIIPSKVIITEFSGKLHGFAVHSVERIHNLDWKDVEHPPELVESEKVYTIGVVRLNDNVALLLDFEKIVADINPEFGIKKDVVVDVNEDRLSKHVLIAEDSAFIRSAMKFTLTKAGYNIVATANGKEAFAKLEYYLKTADSSKKTLKDQVNLLIADMEMPQMDGRELIKKIKANPILQGIPIVIFSSLINEEDDRKVRDLGVNAIISKPEIKKLVEIVDNLLL